MPQIKEQYTKEEIINFNPEDWTWRRSSGYGGYDYKGYLNNESTWIWADDYTHRRRLQREYKEKFELLHCFRRDALPFGQISDKEIQSFLCIQMKLI